MLYFSASAPMEGADAKDNRKENENELQQQEPENRPYRNLIRDGGHGNRHRIRRCAAQRPEGLGSAKNLGVTPAQCSRFSINSDAKSV